MAETMFGAPCGDGASVGKAGDVPMLSFRDVRFSYKGEDGSTVSVLDGASCEVAEGSFVLLVGGTGSGKTTLLRLAKPEIAPVGEVSGSVHVMGLDVADLDVLTSAQLIGYVFQSPDNQIVCDSVWHEMAFGLENLGLTQREMHRRLAETCTFLGMGGLFRRRCDELSGGQRQMVALAAVLAMRPRLLLLDEPTAMLDPVAEQEFLSLLFRANRELGITCVVATHDPAPMVAYVTEALALERGRLAHVDLETLRRRPSLGTPRSGMPKATSPAFELDDAWARYGRGEPWVLRGCDLSVGEGEVRAVVGGNGCGKSTLLAAVAGAVRLQRGRCKRARGGGCALLPQQPKALLSAESVRKELLEWADGGAYGADEVDAALEELGLAQHATRHPYDLSGGQQQMLALEKLLLLRPSLLLLDEPTKGLDPTCRQRLAERVRTLSDAGVAVVVATHDRAFVRHVAHSVSLLFDGTCAEPESCDEFFANTWMWQE